MEIKRFIDGKEVVITLTEDEVQDAGRIAEFSRLCAEVKDHIGYTAYKKAFADMAPEKLAEAVEDIATEVGYKLTYYSGKATQLAAISEALHAYCKNNNLPEDPGITKTEAEKALAPESKKLLVKDIASRATNGTLTVADKELLHSWGHTARDFQQIELAMQKSKTTYNMDGRRITRDEAQALLGRREWLSGISRSAFHHTAARQTYDGRTVLFNSSALFK